MSGAPVCSPVSTPLNPPLCIYDIKFGMLQVRKNEILLRKCSGSSAHLRTLEETVVTRGSARFDNNDCEVKSQVSLL